MFNPHTLVEYQDKFAEAMKPHGLERGVEHSQAKHQPMKKMYGQQGQTAAELGTQLGPASSYQDATVASPGLVGVLLPKGRFYTLSPLSKRVAQKPA